jgi:hypothetical protein
MEANMTTLVILIAPHRSGILSDLLAMSMVKKCIVHGCTNHEDQGSFEGDMCSPCYRIITTGKINPSDNWFVQKIQKLEEELECLKS